MGGWEEGGRDSPPPSPQVRSAHRVNRGGGGGGSVGTKGVLLAQSLILKPAGMGGGQDLGGGGRGGGYLLY